MNITAFDISSAGVFRGFASTEPCLAIVVLMDCAGSSRISSPGCNRPLEFTYTPNSTIFFFARSGVTGEFSVPPGSSFKGIEVRLSRDQLRRLDMLELFDNADSEHSYCRVANSDIWIGGIPTSSTIQARAETALDAALGTGASDLDVEAAGLAILTAALDAMHDHGAPNNIRKRHLTVALDESRGLLMRDLSHAWTVGELAKSVGISERQLKSGFRARFGAPVYAFLQSARLTTAKSLLEQGQLSITEVALAVGYANPSHFTYLFRRAFGMTPSEVTQIKRV